MKKKIIILLLFYGIIYSTYCVPEFTGVWMYTDYSMAAENMIVYEIDQDVFYITVSISQSEDFYEESMELRIVDYDETQKHIKTEAINRNGGTRIFDIHEGDIAYWTYNTGKGKTMYFDVSKDMYPQTAITGPFESPENFENDNDWTEFAGTWYWSNEDGTATETFVFSETHDESDLAVLEMYAEGEDYTGYALFEIPVYNEGNKNIRLMCLESSETLGGYTIGSIWYLTYSIRDREAYFELSRDSYPERATYGPYYKMTGGM